MCNDNQCIKNGTYIGCPICHDLYRVETGYFAQGIIDGNSKQQITMRICPKCYKKMTSVESISVSYEVVGNEDKV